MTLEPDVAELFGGGHFVRDARRTARHPSGRSQTSRPQRQRHRRDARVAASVTDRANPYRSAWLRGHVGAPIEGDDALAIIDRIALAYIGEPFPMRSGVVFAIATEAQGTAVLPFRVPS